MLRTFIFILVVGLATVAVAETAKKTVKEDTKQTLIALENKWADALLKGDAASLDVILSDDYIETNENGVRNHKSDILALVKSGDLKLQSLKFSDLEVHDYGIAAVVTGTGEQKGTYKGKAFEDKLAFTDTFVKTHGQWMAVATGLSPVQ